MALSASVEWLFPANSEIVKKFKSDHLSDDDTLWSDPFLCEGYEVWIGCKFSEGLTTSVEASLWLYMNDKSPILTDKLRATLRFVCDEIGYDVSCTQVGYNKYPIPRPRIPRDKFNNLEEWTFKCEITLHCRWQGPPGIDAKLLGKEFEKSFQTVLNDFNYKKTIYWLLTICQNLIENPHNKQYRQIFCNDIKIKLRKHKYEKLFEAILMWSGFRKNSMDNYTHWMHDKSAIQRTMYLFSFWYGIVYHHTKEMPELIDEGFTAKEILVAMLESMIHEHYPVNDDEEKDEEKKYDPKSTVMEVTLPSTECKDTGSNNNDFIMDQSLPVNSAYLLNTNTIYDGNKCPYKVENCNSFTHIQNILNNYSNITHSTSQNKTQIEIENINHLLLYHSHEYEQIYYILNMKKQCDLLKCDLLKCDLLKCDLLKCDLLKCVPLRRNHAKEIQELIDEGFTAKEILVAMLESMIDENYRANDDEEKDEEKKYDPKTTVMEVTLLSTECKDTGSNDNDFIMNTNTIYDGNKCQYKVENCNLFTRIQNILNNYSNITHSTSENKTETEIENIYDENYNDIDLLNDFNHLLLYHSHEYEQIYNILNMQKQCDLLKCVPLRRNYANRNIDHRTSYISDDICCIIRQQLLDKMHSYFYHRFDTGNKLTQKERETILEQEQKTNNNENNIDYTFSAVKKLNTGKKASFIESSTDKFNVKIDKNKYSHGFRYFYWEWYKDNHLTCDPAVQDFNFATNIGDNIDPKQQRIYTLGEWYIKKKFDNLKDELTNTELTNILCMDQYNNSVHIAAKHLQTSWCREMKCVRKDSKKLYELESAQEIDIKHIIAMMIYCNYDKIQYEFTETFRFTDEIKSNEELKERHRNYYYLGRYLRELVECFGMKCPSKNLHIYHGINRHFTFASMNCFINGPLSTTKSYCVAVNFATNAGMVLNIEIMTDNWIINEEQDKYLNCFDCQLVSDFPSEKEIFFIGGTKYFSFSNITDTKTAIHYLRYIKGIRQMTFTMNNGVHFFDIHNAPKNKIEQQMVLSLLSHEIWRVTNGKMGFEFECCPEYIKEILHQHCQNMIIVGLWKWPLWSDKCIEHEKLLMNNDGWIKLDLVMKVFPNARVIRCNGSNMHLSCIDGKIIAQSLIALLHKNSETMLDELQIYINFKWYEQMKNCIKPYQEKLYDQYNWMVHSGINTNGSIITINFHNYNNMVNLV